MNKNDISIPIKTEEKAASEGVRAHTLYPFNQKGFQFKTSIKVESSR